MTTPKTCCLYFVCFADLPACPVEDSSSWSLLSHTHEHTGCHIEARLQSMATEADDEYYVPLVDQRVFGAGIKRKRIAFVPAANHDSSISVPAKSSNAGSKYLSIVMKTANPHTATATSLDGNQQEVPSTCEICGQKVVGENRVRNSHATSIAHQVCLEHSHPPSHLDRSHVGLKYLQDYGWDPDARLGLGAKQEGIRIPIKAKQKHDSVGLGLLNYNKEDLDTAKQKKGSWPKKNENRAVKLNAKEVRRIEEEKGRRAEKLRRSVYGEDLSQYLGLG